MVAEYESLQASAASPNPEALASLPEKLTRVATRFSLRALEMVDFHHMDEELDKGNLDSKFIGPVKRSVALASPEFFPLALKPLASALKEHLSALEAALVRKDLEASKAQSHGAHEKYHELHHEVSHWLDSSGHQ